MSYAVNDAADTFYDKWLPAFSESMLNSGWADRFHKEITAALLEARAAGIEEAAKVSEEWVADIGDRLMRGDGNRQLLEGGASAASRILAEIRDLAVEECP